MGTFVEGNGDGSLVGFFVVGAELGPGVGSCVVGNGVGFNDGFLVGSLVVGKGVGPGVGS